MYEPVEDGNTAPEDLIQEDIYEACGEEETYDDTAVPELEQDEVYDDCGNTMPAEPPTTPKPLPPTPPAKESARRQVPPPPPTDTPPAPPPVPPSRQVPHIPLPEIPPELQTPKEEKKPIIHPDQDFENKYYGKFDCTADEEHELTFKKGELIHIISKHFDDKEWWVGRIEDRYGLVPKYYLTPAFESSKTRGE